ncbi:lysophospholipase-like protein 1 [Protopterus annectens]|uniref:lysophospholipase-like protein 1 n=1 Tax=Protopterus annectens TaxID=7888 RepID=UPI001CFA6803|nr:lysophospholipase-like protein 1 [Protopterus annectens]
MAVARAVKLQKTVVNELRKHTASVIFLHGSGDTGPGIRAWVKDVLNEDLVFPHIRVVYPTAPARPYTPMNENLSNVWFNRYNLLNDSTEHIETIDSMGRILTNFVEQEVQSGIPLNRIIIGGFSMGGGMAIHLAYRFLPHVAGVFALSSFLNKESICYQVLREYSGPLPELFQCHGESDDLILHQWGEETNKELKALGVPCSFHSFPDLDHELHKAELEMLKSWILQKLPEVME